MENLSYIFLIKPEKATGSGFLTFSVLTMLGANALEKLPMTHTDVCGSCQKGFYLDSSITVN